MPAVPQPSECQQRQTAANDDHHGAAVPRTQ
jgi:hypothetical protein